MNADRTDLTELPGVEESSQFAANMAVALQRGQEVWARMVEAQAKDEHPLHADPLNVMPIFNKLAEEIATNPQEYAAASYAYWTQQAELWRRMVTQAWGIEPEGPVAEPARGDNRFRDQEWSQNQVFDYLKQAYLISSRWAQDVVHTIGDMPERDRRKLEFYTRNITEALSPNNFAFMNPEVLRATMEEKGANLVRGMEAMARDVERGKGKLIISQTDMNAFEVGRDMAVTKGAVIHQTEVLQLIQYAPTTEQVHAKPLFFVPPWINKYYILDLNEKKSMVRWLVDQGYTVFIISWVNPGPDHGKETWDSYMSEIMTAIDVALAETGQTSLNVVGYCVGGTMVGTMLAYMAKMGDKRVSAATLFTAQLEFTNAGDLQVLVDDKTVGVVDEQMDKGYLPAEAMANAFNMLRSSDLIWSYVVQNYMLGKDPFPFDLLFWNADSTCMPAQVHHFYLEQFYNKNALARGTLRIHGEKVELEDIAVPVYHLATREDHIAPAGSVYRGAKLMKNAKNRMVIAGSGHIAGVVNPPALGKYMFWTRPGLRQPDIEGWLQGAEETAGSWWPDWDAWLSKLSGRKVAARQPGAVHGVIEPAPGAFVKERFDKR